MCLFSPIPTNSCTLVKHHPSHIDCSASLTRGVPGTTISHQQIFWLLPLTSSVISSSWSHDREGVTKLFIIWNVNWEMRSTSQAISTTRHRLWTFCGALSLLQLETHLAGMTKTSCPPSLSVSCSQFAWTHHRIACLERGRVGTLKKGWRN